jgi:hypothetical protein
MLPHLDSYSDSAAVCVGPDSDHAIADFPDCESDVFVLDADCDCGFCGDVCLANPNESDVCDPERTTDGAVLCFENANDDETGPNDDFCGRDYCCDSYYVF